MNSRTGTSSRTYQQKFLCDLVKRVAGGAFLILSDLSFPAQATRTYIIAQKWGEAPE
jgi:hypothetical protein